MRKAIFILTVLFLSVVIFSSCNELKKMTEMAPEVKYFGKNVKLTVTPALKSDDGSDEIVFPTETVIGEKFKDNYPLVIFKTGKVQEDPLKEAYKSSYDFKDVIPYRKSMRGHSTVCVISRCSC